MLYSALSATTQTERRGPNGVSGPGGAHAPSPAAGALDAAIAARQQRDEAERYLALLEAGLPKSTDPVPLAWIDRLVREPERFQAALRWLGAYGEAARAIGVAQALLKFWSARRHRFAAVALRAQQQRSIRCGVAVALEQDFRLARLLCEESRAVVAQIGVRQRQAAALVRLAATTQHQGDSVTAAALLAKALVLYRQLGDQQGTRLCLERLTALDAHVSPLPTPPTPSTPSATPLLPPVALRTEPEAAPGQPFRRTQPPAQTRSPAASLSPRELEVAALIARGLTNREIAAALVIAERTAATHVVHILNKLGVRSRAQVAAWYVREVDGIDALDERGQAAGEVAGAATGVQHSAGYQCPAPRARG